ncbi:Hcp family type VI secretion system effector [Paracidovorax cattleyae]|uniref:Type VI secretion system secreted protein Hcp n=1 Tax=Paracidovorax cattleyae TaxID=80868 RepID=A0A1H0W537_9BURK|nr:type VI secretion system tube protein Hcp [Paracidovorax cattleyae]AVS73768.1 Hcp1 family type VI secretion system effector [Paracidovorax cattleyae]MBF9263283.1 type VI secretion system tube protein Hcp [Paracidovorax cattleyae]SDP85446.1 type VI secretion system secreted protein Hcp [Paracidovorax cattleyae]
MSVDMFMKVEGASGESQDANHKSWTDIRSFTWGATQPNSMATGSGAGAGKVTFHDLNIVAKIDKAYPAVLKHCSSGKHLGQVEISMCKAGGTQIEFSKITLTDVLVTSVTVSGTDGSDAVLVNYAFQAAKIKTQYWEQTNQGGKGAESSAGWNIKENKEA